MTWILVIIELNFCKTLKPHYLKNEKHFFKFLLHFCNLHKTLHILKSKVSFIAQILGRLLTPKNVVAWTCETSCFGTPFGSQSSHRKQTLLKSVWHDLYPNFPLILDKLSQKKSLFLWCEMLRVLGKTLAADHKYSRENWLNFPQHVKTPLSQKRKPFFPIFIGFF